MKKYVVYAILMAGTTLSSCSSSFLDQEPPLYIEPGDIYNDANRLEAAVLGLYGSIKNDASDSFMGGKTYLVFDNRGEDIVNSDPNLITLANTYKFNVGKTDAENTVTWSMAYAAINRVNIFLDELEGAKAADYTRHRQTEEVQRKEREAELLAQAEKRRAAQRSRTGFDPIPADFCPRLTDWQIAVLTKHINRIGIFKRDTTEEEIARLLACQLAEPLQTTHNKLLALLLESLSASRLITPKWQRVAGNNGCFTSKLGKPLTAKDLSAAKQMAEIIDRRKERMIIDCIEALEAAE